ncbi:ArnT family glycosyltransferase [Clostridium hydrogenum]|uniref:glycosyltransferase family 39 protein n=1 Tax=Clostridium hydrogenum TaxID=2855764 RepID=UPI001F440FC4|nr:glycosyltransferase family 39 protein [Clostridium hydrogenum]
MKAKINLKKERIYLYLILLLSFILNFFNLGIEGYGNTYYAAGVKSMLLNFKNFFFVSFDPSGFVTIDKPPIGFWLQAVSAKVLGFSGFSIILPQALCGVISVFLIYYIIKNTFGTNKGLLAALCLSVTPIFVAASRNNTIDNDLVLCLLLSVLFIIKAVRSGSLRFLLLSFFFIGVGFNVKMSEAYLILPALYLSYFLYSRLSLKRRTINLCIATAVLIVVSLSWALAVDAVPAKNRPFIGSSTNNTVTELILGHNGFDRLKLGNIFKSSHSHRKANVKLKSAKISNANLSGLGNESQTGFTRLIGNNDISDQIGFLISMAILGFIAAALKEQLGFSIDNERKMSLLLFFMWFLTEFIFFSFSKGSFHTYYLTTMAPAIAALTGIGTIDMINFKDKKVLIFPLSIILTAIIEITILYYNHTKSSGYIPIMLLTAVICLIFSTIFVLNTLSNKNAKLAASFAFAGILIAPTIWSATPIFLNMNSGSPSAGLELYHNPHPFKNKAAANPNSKLAVYLEKNSAHEKYLVAVPSATTYASSLILETDKPIMTFGGFSGNDKIISLNKFKKLVYAGKIKYAILSSQNNAIKGNNKAIINWIKRTGKIVSNHKWQNTNSISKNPSKLYYLSLKHSIKI